MTCSDLYREGSANIIPGNTTGYGLGMPLEGAVPAPPPEHDTTSLLQRLLDADVDGSRAFDEAAELVGVPHLAELFKRIATERREMAEELARYLGDRGGQPDADGTLISTVHRAWVRLKAAVSGNDEAMILEEVESFDDQVRQMYDHAMSVALPEETRAMLARHRDAIDAGNERVRAMHGRGGA